MMLITNPHGIQHDVAHCGRVEGSLGSGQIGLNGLGPRPAWFEPWGWLAAVWECESGTPLECHQH